MASLKMYMTQHILNLEANMEANFYEPGDYITYTVTVSNLGTLDAI